MKFITVQTEKSGDVTININHIVTIIGRNSQSSWINCSDGSSYAVKESMDEINSKIMNAQMQKPMQWPKMSNEEMIDFLRANDYGIAIWTEDELQGVIRVQFESMIAEKGNELIEQLKD